MAKATGGKREGAGRPKGAVNKTTAEIRALAQEHGQAAIQRLVHLMNHAENETTQVAACKELLDRAYGKAPQAIVGGDEDSGENHPIVIRLVTSGSGREEQEILYNSGGQYGARRTT